MGIEPGTVVLSIIGPELVLVIAALGLMVTDAFIKNKSEQRPLLWIGLAGILGSLAVAWSLWGREPAYGFSGMVVVDNFSTFFTVLFLTAGGLTLLLSDSYVRKLGLAPGEYYALTLFATSGMVLMARSTDLIMLFLGLEVLSVSLYVLAGYLRSSDRSAEGALKYFLLGAFSTGFLLYGIALLYGVSGSTRLADIGTMVAQENLLQQPMLLAGMGLLLTGFGFKVAMVPFHMWAPDVYEGAPSPITAYMSVGVKAAAFAALLRVFSGSLAGLDAHWRELLWIGSVLTMTLGNLAALLQNNIKRMLAYSSIAHAGYILIGVVAGGEIGTAAVLYYLLVYTLMNIGAFAVVIAIEKKDEQQLDLRDYAGLGAKHPALGVAMAIFMFSLAGIPPLSGFMGKFYIFSAAVKQGYLALTIIGVLNSLVSVYYYLRVTIMMFMKEPEGEPAAVIFQPALIIVLIVAVFFTIQMGLFPATYLQIAKSSIRFFL
jgi:NADH-quinone oxidoreductase subunit N